MAKHSLIEWTDATWNPITGCRLASEGCRHCYAATLAATRLKSHPSRAGLARMNAAGEAKFTGEVRFNEAWLDQPLRWKRSRLIFVCAHSDLFYEEVPDAWIDRVFAVMALSPQHVFQVLTKRPERAREYLWARNGMGDASLCKAINAIPSQMGNRRGALEMPLPNVWLGVSVEDQATADARIPVLLDTPAAKRWVSYEPALGEVDFQKWLMRCKADRDGDCSHPACPQNRDGEPYATGRHCPIDTWPTHYDDDATPLLDGIVAGGESGARARPAHPGWFRRMRDDCAAAGTPFDFKQWGEWVSVSEVAGPGAHFQFPDGATVRRVGKKTAGRLLDGQEHAGFTQACREALR